jgi:hypothetical protein
MHQCTYSRRKVAGTLRRAVRWSQLTGGLVDGTWNVSNTLSFVSCINVAVRQASLDLVCIRNHHCDTYFPKQNQQRALTLEG